MGGGRKSKLFHDNIIDELLPEARGHRLALQSMVDRENIADGNTRSEAFPFNPPPPFSGLVVDGHIEWVLGRGSFREGVSDIGTKGNRPFSSDESP